MPPLQYPKSSRILSSQAKAFQKKNVHCNIVKHTTKPHRIGAIENINTIDDYGPKIVRIIVFLLPSQATLCNQNTVSREI